MLLSNCVASGFPHGGAGASFALTTASPLRCPGWRCGMDSGRSVPWFAPFSVLERNSAATRQKASSQQTMCHFCNSPWHGPTVFVFASALPPFVSCLLFACTGSRIPGALCFMPKKRLPSVQYHIKPKCWATLRGPLLQCDPSQGLLKRCAAGCTSILSVPFRDSPGLQSPAPRTQPECWRWLGNWTREVK